MRKPTKAQVRAAVMVLLRKESNTMEQPLPKGWPAKHDIPNITGDLMDICHEWIHTATSY